jgi:acyl-[acyl-carrier-protein]-phospholipid O-acyltransferase / long-chain-fatty-acid--[acyl-carrier-protein] ligase
MVAIGHENLPEVALLIPNQLRSSSADLLQSTCERPIRFVSGTNAGAPLDNELICLLSDERPARPGATVQLPRSIETLVRELNLPVVPVWIDPENFGRRRAVFGTAIKPQDATIAFIRERLLELGEGSYEEQPILRGHLAHECIRGLRKNQFDIAVVDGADGATLSRGTLLASAIVLGRHLRRNCAERRIALVLPPSKAAVVANLATIIADKVPVNLNFTAGRAALETAIRIAEIKTVITAGPVMQKFPDFPWPGNVVQLEKLVPLLKKQIAVWRALVLGLPAELLARLNNVPSLGDHQEAVLLFTSGSSGEPKGVVLSHRNILANVSQFGLMLNLGQRDTVLASLPFFHSFGSTVTLWYPLIEGVRMLTYPNPLDVPKNAQLVQEHHVTLFLATPGFLRGYLRRAEKEQLASVQLAVVGAEKLPQDLAQSFETRFGKQVLEGYGLTETAPVVSVNLPEPETESGKTAVPSSRPGSVGQLVPGVAARIRDPESDGQLSLHDTGMLWLKGPNIFEGYLKDSKRTADVLHDGWFKTGDLGRFDEDGFLYIEGRLSRFSKIAGEMVPHETVESKITELLGAAGDERSVAVIGVPDEAKCEALVLLSTREIDLGQLRSKLLNAGVSSLWIPKKVRGVDAIPVLASGKLDLRRCHELALNS